MCNCVKLTFPIILNIWVFSYIYIYPILWLQIVHLTMNSYIFQFSQMIKLVWINCFLCISIPFKQTNLPISTNYFLCMSFHANKRACLIMNSYVFLAMQTSKSFWVYIFLERSIYTYNHPHSHSSPSPTISARDCSLVDFVKRKVGALLNKPQVDWQF